MQESEKQQESRGERSEDKPLAEEEVRMRTEALRRVGIFSDLPEEQLRWFTENATERRFAAGEIIFERGARAEWMIVYLEGEAHVVGDDNRLDDFVFIIRAGDPLTEVTGMLPYSRMTEFTYAIRAVIPTRVLLFPTSLFSPMLERMPVLAQRLVGVMSDRVRESTKMDVQQDKLMALGKLSAGLAHELNNPASAARRAADELLDALNELRAADLRLCRHDFSADQLAFITEFEQQAIARQETASPLGSLEQSDHEDALASWLESQDLWEGRNVASHLAEAGIEHRVSCAGLITSRQGGVRRCALASGGSTPHRAAGRRHQGRDHADIGTGRRDQRVFIHGSGFATGDRSA